MLDASPHIAPHQRVRGRASVAIGAQGRLEDLHQSGAAKAMLPKMHGRPAEVVFLNTAGGVTGGDDLHYSLDVAAGARATGTTQTAERAYRAGDGDGVGRITTRLTVGAGAALMWLPQEVIVFDGARLDRVLEADLDADARLVTCETLVLGRRAMGERLTDVAVTDRRTVRRAGRVIGQEALGIDAADLRPDGPHPAGLAGATALATLCLFAADAPDHLARLRHAIAAPAPGLRVAASAWDGRLVVRCLALDATPLRPLLARAIRALTQGDLPRVWQI